MSHSISLTKTTSFVRTASCELLYGCVCRTQGNGRHEVDRRGIWPEIKTKATWNTIPSGSKYHGGGGGIPAPRFARRSWALSLRSSALDAARQDLAVRTPQSGLGKVLVGAAGFEPACLAAADFKSAASANSATPPQNLQCSAKTRVLRYIVGDQPTGEGIPSAVAASVSERPTKRSLSLTVSLSICAARMTSSTATTPPKITGARLG